MPCGQCATADSLRTHGPEPLLIRPRPLSHNSNAPGDSRATRASASTPACRGLVVGHPSGSSEARHSRSRRALLPGSRRNNPTVSSVSHGLPLTEFHHVSSGPVNPFPASTLSTAATCTRHHKQVGALMTHERAQHTVAMQRGGNSGKSNEGLQLTTRRLSSSDSEGQGCQAVCEQ